MGGMPMPDAEPPKRCLGISLQLPLLLELRVGCPQEAVFDILFMLANPVAIVSEASHTDSSPPRVSIWQSTMAIPKFM